MSHFTVLVIGADHEAQLAPYHEFECTGINDEHVQSIDETADVLKNYNSETMNCIMLATGVRVGAYDDRFYREKTPAEKLACGIWERSRKERDVAGGGGVEEVKVPWSEYGTIFEYIAYTNGDRPLVREGETLAFTDEHASGYTLVDGKGAFLKTFNRTNPNAHWDWYLVGGRWTGFFPLKDGAVGETGKPGLMTNAAEVGTADQCRWGDVDFGKARRKNEERAKADFQKWAVCLSAGPEPKSWLHFRETAGDRARDLYGAQPVIAAFRKLDGHMMRCPVDVYGFDMAAYAAREVGRALVPFAVVKDGKWHEKGSMGWWGCVSDEKGQADWNGQVAALLDGLDPNTQVTLVDCHI